MWGSRVVVPTKPRQRVLETLHKGHPRTKKSATEPLTRVNYYPCNELLGHLPDFRTIFATREHFFHESAGLCSRLENFILFYSLLFYVCVVSLERMKWLNLSVLVFSSAQCHAMCTLGWGFVDRLNNCHLDLCLVFWRLGQYTTAIQNSKYKLVLQNRGRNSVYLHIGSHLHS